MVMEWNAPTPVAFGSISLFTVKALIFNCVSSLLFTEGVKDHLCLYTSGAFFSLPMSNKNNLVISKRGSGGLAPLLKALFLLRSTSLKNILHWSCFSKVVHRTLQWTNSFLSILSFSLLLLILLWLLLYFFIFLQSFLLLLRRFKVINAKLLYLCIFLNMGVVAAKPHSLMTLGLQPSC